jgi:outer membrane protein assembly factor BamB
VFGPEETPQWERSSLGPIKGSALTETRIYVGTGGYRKLLSINLADGSTKWEYLTTGLGDVGQPTYSYDADNDTYKIVATAGSYAVGRQDDGTASSQLFAPVYLGTQTGTPYIGIGDTTFYVPYDDKLTRRNIDDGTEAAGWPQTVANLSPRADIVVEQDMVFCATSDGKVHKYDTDGTPLGTFSGIAGNASVELPLFLDRTGLLVTPSSAKVYCVDINTMSEKWNVDLSAANTGPLFAKYGDVAYVAADRYVERITLGSAPAGVDWSYDAATAVESGPIALDSIVYFGTTSGRYFAIDDDQTSVTRVERWPYTKASGNANAGPWVSDGNRLVIFGTEGQYLSAFRLVE